MDDITRIFMSHGNSKGEAEELYSDLMDDFYSCLEVGDFMGAEDVLNGYGLELDYALCLI